MSRFLVAIALFGVVVAVSATGGHAKEWEGKPWLGKWVSTDRKENWEAFVAALDLPEQYGVDSQRIVHVIWKEGDHYHHELDIPDKNFKKDLEFRLGHESITQFKDKEVKIRYSEEGSKLIADVQIPAKNKNIHDVYEVKGDELVKTYKVGNVEAKRWFKKEAHA